MNRAASIKIREFAKADKTLTIIADKRWTKHRRISMFSWPEIGWARLFEE
jgi:hypothetical protein